MEAPKTATEATKTAPEKECSKSSDMRIFTISLLTSIIVVGAYHFGIGVCKIYFPKCEEDYICEEVVEEDVVAGEQANEASSPKGHFKGKKPSKHHKFDKDGKPPRKFGKDGKPPRRPPFKGKKPAPEKADAPVPEKAPAKADAPATVPAQEKAPAAK